MDTRTRSSLASTASEYISIFSNQFTTQEMDFMRSRSSEEARYVAFYVNWSLKEAFIKALGIGLACNLKFVHFMISFAEGTACAGSAVVYVEGRRREDWRFDFFSLDAQHVMSIARSVHEGEGECEPLPPPELKTVEAIASVLRLRI